MKKKRSKVSFDQNLDKNLTIDGDKQQKDEREQPMSIKAEEEEEEDNPYTITEDMLRERLTKRSTGKKRTQVYAAIMGKLISCRHFLCN